MASVETAAVIAATVHFKHRASGGDETPSVPPETGPEPPRTPTSHDMLAMEGWIIDRIDRDGLPYRECARRILEEFGLHIDAATLWLFRQKRYDWHIHLARYDGERQLDHAFIERDLQTHLPDLGMRLTEDFLLPWLNRTDLTLDELDKATKVLVRVDRMRDRRMTQARTARAHRFREESGRDWFKLREEVLGKAKGEKPRESGWEPDFEDPFLTKYGRAVKDVERTRQIAAAATAAYESALGYARFAKREEETLKDRMKTGAPVEDYGIPGCYEI